MTSVQTQVHHQRLAAGEDERRLATLAAWREAPFFTERERATLALTDAVTRLGAHGVRAIAAINTWNSIGVPTRLQPES